MDLRRQPFTDDPFVDASDDAGGWAHASAWALLSGRKRRLSCLLSCHNEAQQLSHLLPRLSDVLTECGYPWEVIVVDRGSDDATVELARAWTQLPGFRCLRVRSNGRDGRDIEAGLLAARGDAVIVLDPQLGADALDGLRRLVLAWEADAVLAHAGDDGVDDPMSAWTADQIMGDVQRGDWALPPQCLRLGLIDRRVVDWLIAA